MSLQSKMQAAHKATRGFALAMAIFHAPCLQACQDIALLSNDARFLVLDGRTLETRDVGNLWWLGIRRIDGIIAGSTLERTAFWTDSLVDTTTGTYLGSGDSTLIQLTDLGRSLRVQSELPTFESKYRAKAWWLDSSRLIVFENRGPSDYVLSLMDRDLSPVSEWVSDERSLGFGLACKAGEDIYVGSLYRRFRWKGGSGEPLPQPDEGGEFRLTTVSSGCTALMVKVDEMVPKDMNAAKVTIAVVDLASNRVLSTFRSKRTVRHVLLDKNDQLLLQELTSQKEGGGYRVSNTDRVEVLDLNDGTVVRSASLGVDGELRKINCRGPEDLVFLVSPGELHRIDLTTLTVIKSVKVPFDKYFVL